MEACRDAGGEVVRGAPEFSEKKRCVVEGVFCDEAQVHRNICVQVLEHRNLIGAFDTFCKELNIFSYH